MRRTGLMNEGVCRDHVKGEDTSCQTRFSVEIPSTAFQTFPSGRRCCRGDNQADNDRTHFVSQVYKEGRVCGTCAPRGNDRDSPVGVTVLGAFGEPIGHRSQEYPVVSESRLSLAVCIDAVLRDESARCLL